jgi:UDP-GlcNAc:undecaprenyl-phosphate/decaprenyl-phosphate GlcNAc-1-phosphate transferase
VSAVVTIAAFPVATIVLWTLLHSPLGGRLVAVPTGERWHERATPSFGGVGIYAGFAAGVLLAIAVGAVDASSEILGVLGGATLLFAAGLADDLFTLRPVAKLGAQFGAAGIVLASGLSVEIVGNDVLAVALALVWLVGITNAFNLLDNMDGLAATLAAIACSYYALDAVTEHPNRVGLVLALALGLACVGFLPFNLRPGRAAAVFMGDSGSQLLGFTLAALALSSSWKVAGTTVTTVLLPLLVLAVPILDTTLVTIVRLLERRPVTQGGRDHSSHRLVYYGLSEGRAVALLAAVATAVGATGVAYNILDEPRVTIFGVLVTFVLLVQFASVLADLEERSRRGDEGGPVTAPALLQPRRLIEVLTDFASILAAFTIAYLLLVDGLGTGYQRHLYVAALPILLGTRYVAFVAFVVYRRIWRFAGARDLSSLAAATFLSAPVALGLLAATQPLKEFPWQIFVVDALLCFVLVAASRLALRALPELRDRDGKRILIVGAGRSGRSLARELQETAGERVIGYLDDNLLLRRRRIQGVIVIGNLDDAARFVPDVDEVLVTIPDAPVERLQPVLDACTGAGVSCRFVRRDTVLAPASLVEATAE